MTLSDTKHVSDVSDIERKTRPHSLKLKGQFAISSHLQQIATEHGLSIERMKNGFYAVSGIPDLDVVCPKHIQRSGQFFDARSLQQFLEFMHQPIRASSGSQEQRETTHRLLRFMHSGSSNIKHHDHHGHIQRKECDQHHATESAMRDEDAWNTHPEIGNHKSAISSIPETEFDPKQGFVFSIPHHGKSGAKQKVLEQKFWSIINEVTLDRYADKPEKIALTATELHEFCNRVHDHYGQINSLISAIDTETTYQEHIASIEARIVKLSSTPNQNSTDRLTLLMSATTALTPLLNSEEMHQIWARYHFMKRHNAPIASIAQKFHTMHSVMKKYAASGDLSEAQVEAITLEFYPLLAFAKDVATILGEAQIAETIGKAHPMGFSLSDHFMRDDHSATLDDLRKTTQHSGSALKNIVCAGWKTTKDFALDIVSFICESPRTAAVFVGLASALYVMNGGDAEITQTANDTIMIFGESGLEAMTIDPDSLPEEAKTSQNWHWDMGPLGMYKHYMYDNAVIGPAQTMMDWVRMGIHSVYEALGININPEPAFSKAASETTKPLADMLFDGNVLQNCSHAGLWAYIYSRGHRYGLRGGKRIFELLSPITDLGYTAFRRAKDIMTLKKKTHLSEMLAGKVEKHNVQHETVNVLGEAAQTREAIVPPSLQKKGLSFEFQVRAEHAEDMITALNQFDTVLEHIADKIGIEEPWYQKFLQNKIRQATDALKQFQDDGDLTALKKTLDCTLTDIVGAQIRHFGQSNIVVMDEKTQSRLHAQANTTFGRMKRSHKLEETNNIAVKTGTRLWGGIVKAARSAQKYSTLVPAKPVLIGTAGALAASVGLDMAGYESSVTDTLSSLAGSLTSGAATTTAFLVYNFWEDVLGVHVGSGAALLAAGATTGYIYRRGIQPIALSIAEPFRDQPHAPAEP